jgi:hypothetical protein
MRRLAIAALSAPVAILVATGCGTTHAPTSAPSASASSPSASPSPAAVDYGTQYLADVTPLNNADDAIGKARTNKQNIRAYRRLSRIEQSTAAKMLRQAWPAKAEARVHTEEVTEEGSLRKCPALGAEWERPSAGRRSQAW